MGKTSSRHLLPTIRIGILLILIFLVFRTSWTIAEDDSFVFYGSVALPIFAGLISGWQSWKASTIIPFVSLIGFGTRFAFALELIFHSPAATFPRDRIAVMYFDNITYNMLSVLFATIYSAIIGGTLGVVISRSRKNKNR